jgi:hypothetical protein
MAWLNLTCIPLQSSDLTRVNALLSTRLENIVPRLNAPAALPPTPAIASTTQPSRASPKTPSEKADEEIAEALRRNLTTSFLSPPNPFTFSPQPAPEPEPANAATLPLLTAAGVPAPFEGAEYICRHCGNAFRSIFAINGHKTHSKKCSAKGRKAGLDA